MTTIKAITTEQEYEESLRILEPIFGADPSTAE